MDLGRFAFYLIEKGSEKYPDVMSPNPKESPFDCAVFTPRRLICLPNNYKASIPGCDSFFLLGGGREGGRGLWWWAISAENNCTKLTCLPKERNKVPLDLFVPTAETPIYETLFDRECLGNIRHQIEIGLIVRPDLDNKTVTSLSFNRETDLIDTDTGNVFRSSLNLSNVPITKASKKKSRGSVFSRGSTLAECQGPSKEVIKKSETVTISNIFHGTSKDADWEPFGFSLR